MGQLTTLTITDGHTLDAYVAHPQGEPIAGLVIVQEIFGVNAHIRSVADGYAADGFFAVAPALFDRVERGVELGYDATNREKAMSLLRKLDIDKAVLDVAAALDFARAQTAKKVGVIGYCFGGSVAWLAATRLKPDAAVGYYGGQIPKYAAETPHSPVMLHFGEQDMHIPEAEVDKLEAAHPEVEVFWYDAGHAFNCEPRPSYNADAARVARERSLAFLKKHLG